MGGQQGAAPRLRALRCAGEVVVEPCGAGRRGGRDRPTARGAPRLPRLGHAAPGPGARRPGRRAR
eukprot:3478987-Alexandrium_andersonii.AAC.1